MTPEEVRQTVFQHKPVFATILREKGSSSLLQYFSENLTLPPVQNPLRQAALVNAVQKLVGKLLGQSVATSVAAQLQKHYYVSTADHHGPLSHPFFLNGTLVQALANQAAGEKNIIALACGGISLNNSSFPRGLLFHDRELREQRLPFFSLKYRHQPMYGCPAYARPAGKQLLATLNHLGLPAADVETLTHFLKKTYGTENVFAPSLYADQVTITNYALWKQIPGQENTNLIYLQQEDVAVELLLTHHLQTSTIINQLIFNPDTRKVFEKYFEGIIGAFSTKDHKGTYLFWALKDGLRQPLELKNGELVTSTGDYRLELHPEAVTLALEQKTIMPSMALTFIILSFYHGLTCGGGFSQVNYLTDLRNAYEQFLKEIEAPQTEIADIQVRRTDYFSGEIILATLGNKTNRVPATSLDLILYANAGLPETLSDQAAKTSLATAIDGMMPEYYKIITGRQVELDKPIPLSPPSAYA